MTTISSAIGQYSPLLERLGRFSPGRQRLLLTLGCLLLFFTWWTRVPLTELDEAVYGEVTREMVASHNYLVPYFNYTQYYEKPAFVYWMQAAAVQLFGLRESSLRIPSAIFSLLLVLMIHAFLLRWLIRQGSPPEARARARGAAFLGGIALMIMPYVASWSRAATLDAQLTVFTTGTLLALLHADLLRRTTDDSPALSRRLRRWYLIGAGCAGLSFLTKGPVGIIVPGLIWIIFHLRERSLWMELKRVPWLPSILLFVIIALPWYVAITLKDGPEFLKVFFYNENIGRFALVVRDGHGFGYTLGGRLLALTIYPSLAIILLFPFSAFLLHEVFVPFAGNTALATDPVLARMRRFAWCWILADIGFFSLALTQNVNYIHAIVGGAGLLFALHVLGRLSPAQEWRQRCWARGLEMGVLTGFGLLFPLLIIYAVRFHRFVEARFGPAPLPQTAAQVTLALALAAVAGLGFVTGIWWWKYRRADARLLAWSVAAWAPLYLAFLLGTMLYGIGNYLRIVEVGAFVRTQPPGERILVYNENHPESLVFNARRYIEYYLQPEGQRWFPFQRDGGQRHLPLDQEIRRAVRRREPLLLVTNDAGAREMAALASFTVLRRFGETEVLRLQISSPVR